MGGKKQTPKHLKHVLPYRVSVSPSFSLLTQIETACLSGQILTFFPGCHPAGPSPPPPCASKTLMPTLNTHPEFYLLFLRAWGLLSTVLYNYPFINIGFGFFFTDLPSIFILSLGWIITYKMEFYSFTLVNI